MSQKNEMVATYTQLAPEFLDYLGRERKKLEAQIDRLAAVAEAEPEELDTSDPPADNGPDSLEI